MRYLRKEDGSTLLLVIIAVAVLTTLGTTVLALNYMNYNMKYTDQRMKETLYYSESGLDQVYSRVARYVDLAIVHASKETKDDIAYNEGEKDLIQAAIKVISETINNSNLVKEGFYNYYKDNVYDISDPSVNMSETEFVDRKLYLHLVLTQYKRSGGNADLKALVENVVSDLDQRRALDLFDLADVDDFLRFESMHNGEMIKITTATAIEHKAYDIITDPGEITTFADEQMKHYFKNYFVANEAQFLIDVFGTVSVPAGFEYLNTEVTGTNSSYTIEYGGIDNFNGANPDTFVISDVSSAFLTSGVTDVKKTISTDIVVELPSLFVPLEVAERVHTMKDNPLWQYALITNSDIDLNATTTSIDGSIYALGNKPLDTDFAQTRDSKNYDGVSVRGDNSTTTITGDVVTQSYVQISEESSNSTLNIVNGHVYCDSFVIQKGSVNSNINVDNGNVYTQDDLELNGENAHISIDGSYFGFMNSAFVFNKTSAIVINSNLSDAGSPQSSIEITGKKADIYAAEPTEGILVAGVSFINDDFTPDPYASNGIGASDLYQTAESMGIKRNYLAYFFPSAVTNDEQTVSVNGLNMYYKNNTGDLLTLDEKITHFEAVDLDPVYNLDTGGGNINIDLDKYLYTAGVVVGNDNLNAPKFDSFHEVDLSIVSEYAEKDILRDYIYILNNLRNREIGNDDLSLFKELPSDIPPERADQTPQFLPAVTLLERARTATVISNFSKLNEAQTTATSVFDLDPTDDILPGRLGPEGYNGTNIVGKQVKIAKVDYNDINGSVRNDTYDHANNFLLLGSNYGNVVDIHGAPVTTEGVWEFSDGEYYVIMADASTDVIHGIVATVGKVRMLGTLDYFGSIIAYDDIVIGPDAVVNSIGGTHDISIVNEDLSVQNYLTELINVTRKFNEDFNDISGWAATDNIPMPEIRYVEDVIIASGNTDAMRQHFGEFIYYENWRIIE